MQEFSLVLLCKYSTFPICAHSFLHLCPPLLWLFLRLLSLTSAQCTWVSHWSRPDSSSMRQQIVFVCSCSFDQANISRLGPFDSCFPLSMSSCRALGKHSWASPLSCAWAPAAAGVLVMVLCPCPGRSSSAAQTVTGRWWVQRPIWQASIPQEDKRCSTLTSPGSLSLCTQCLSLTKGCWSSLWLLVHGMNSYRLKHGTQQNT